MAKVHKPAAKKAPRTITIREEFRKLATLARRKGVLILGPFSDPQARGKAWYHVFNKANPDRSIDINQRYMAHDLYRRIQSLPNRTPQARTTA